jgi:hypothetical protein
MNPSIINVYNENKIDNRATSRSNHPEIEASTYIPSVTGI